MTSFRFTTKRSAEQAPNSKERSSNIKESSVLDNRRQDALTSLDNMIRTIESINNLVPIEIDKNILSSVVNIRSLLDKSAETEEDFKDLIQKCRDICATLAGEANARPSDQMSDALRGALLHLNSSVDNLHVQVHKDPRHSRARRFFSVATEESQTSKWSSDLYSILLTFSAKLQLIASIRLEKIYQSMKPPGANRMPELPPIPPTVFFGREALCSRVKDALLDDQDVALIGPSGIGKTCIARALANDEDIKKRYERRFIVPYGPMDPESITLDAFIDRTANVLGLATLGTESQHPVKSNLALSPVLIVLDNAEKFEVAANPEAATRIAAFISEIANIPGVTIVLTTRTGDVARGVRWTRVEVPKLEKAPARQYFRTICRQDISDDDIDTLLVAVDFRPSSIRALAHSAEENQWNGKELLKEWHARPQEVLKSEWDPNLWG